MSNASTEFKRLLLRGIAWDSQDAGVRLQEGLKAASRARLTETSTGSFLIGATGNGSSVTFAIPSGSQLTPEGVASACSNLYDLYEECVADLTAAEISPETDAKILREMLSRLNPRKAVYADRSGACLAA